MFVGDSIQRNMWESFVCLVQSVIPEGHKSMKQDRVHSVFKAKVIDHHLRKENLFNMSYSISSLYVA